MLNDKTILITGGTGSLGKKLVQIIVQKYKPHKLIIFSRDELKQFEMSQRWNVKEYPFIRYFLGDVRDKDRLIRAFSGVDYVIHTAALKQVPAAEYNPEEFVKTNIVGAMNVIDAALFSGVEKVIALSTDKACNPINLYGATKLCSDKLFVAANAYRKGNKTIFSVVRYGNVLGSRGSVVPFFEERKKTETLPITDERMTRFWITLDQAAHFVLFCFSKMVGGEIFVPKIPSMKIVDLAEAIAPGCQKEIVGIRPGEKIHETLISPDDAHNTIELEQFYIVQPNRTYTNPNIEKNSHKTCESGFAYSSDNNKEWIKADTLREVINQIADDFSIEKSRWLKEGVPA